MTSNSPVLADWTSDTKGMSVVSANICRYSMCVVC